MVDYRQRYVDHGRGRRGERPHQGADRDGERGLTQEEVGAGGARGAEGVEQGQPPVTPLSVTTHREQQQQCGGEGDQTRRQDEEVDICPLAVVRIGPGGSIDHHLLFVDTEPADSHEPVPPVEGGIGAGPIVGEPFLVGGETFGADGAPNPPVAFGQLIPARLVKQRRGDEDFPRGGPPGQPGWRRRVRAARRQIHDEELTVVHPVCMRDPPGDRAFLLPLDQEHRLPCGDACVPRVVHGRDTDEGPRGEQGHRGSHGQGPPMRHGTSAGPSPRAVTGSEQHERTVHELPVGIAVSRPASRASC